MNKLLFLCMTLFMLSLYTNTLAVESVQEQILQEEIVQSDTSDTSGTSGTSLTWLENVLPASVMVVITGLISLAAAIATVLPGPKEGANSFYLIFYNIVQFIALNFGKAKNKSE